MGHSKPAENPISPQDSHYTLGRKETWPKTKAFVFTLPNFGTKKTVDTIRDSVVQNYLIVLVMFSSPTFETVNTISLCKDPYYSWNRMFLCFVLDSTFQNVKFLLRLQQQHALCFHHLLDTTINFFFICLYWFMHNTNWLKVWLSLQQKHRKSAKMAWQITNLNSQIGPG